MIGAGCSEVFAWGSSTADYDDVRLYSGAADADAVASIYTDTTPAAAGSWDFENGVDGLEIVGNVTAYEDEVQGNVLNVAGDYTDFTKSYVRLENPLYQAEGVDGVTISMNMFLTTDGTNANEFEGHWRFANGTTDQDGFFGMVANGGLRL